MIISKDCYLAKGELISQYISDKDIPPNETMISHVSYINNSFFFETFYKGEEMKEKAWLPIMQFKKPSNNKTEVYIIHQGDMLKFGRIEVKIRDICIEGKKSNSISHAIKNELLSTNKITSNHNLISSSTLDLENKRACRICFCDNTEESPLINPCHCSGGIKYVHLNCLQLWLKTKRILRSSTNDNCIAYTYKNLECELCKSPLPDLVQSGEEYYEIWNFIEPSFKSYIIMETVSPIIESQYNNPYKTIFIVNFNSNKEIRIGRSHDSDFRIKDLSVSRLHAQMSITKSKEVMMHDLNSKFGTIVLIQNQKLPISQFPLTIQFGKNILTINLKIYNKISSLLKCYSCNGGNHTRLIDYNKLNSKEIKLVKSFTIKEEKINNNICCLKEAGTQGLGKDSDDNNRTNPNSSIEDEIEMKTVNNLSNFFGLKVINEYYLENKKKRHKQAKRNSAKKSIHSNNYLKKYRIDSENYYYNEIKTVKSVKIKENNDFAEDFNSKG